jgi:chromosome segregation ATPase
MDRSAPNTHQSITNSGYKAPRAPITGGGGDYDRTRDEIIDELHREKQKVNNLEKDVRDMEYNLNALKSQSDGHSGHMETQINQQKREIQDLLDHKNRIQTENEELKRENYFINQKNSGDIQGLHGCLNEYES